MALTLTEVAVQVHADMTRVKPEAVAGATVAGKAAGGVLGDGMTSGAVGQLHNDKGKFAAGGSTAAAKFSKGFQGGIDGTFAKVAATMASKFALMGGAAAAAAPGVLHLTAALVPAAGAALALPAALLGLKAASSVAKIAVLGVGDAIKAGFGDNAKAADKALEKLTGNARAFAGQVINLRPQVLGLKDIISDRFFLPLLNDVRPLADLYLPMLRKNIGNLAGPLGGLAEQLAQTARSGLVFNTVTQVMQQTRLSVIGIRGAIDPLAKTLAILVKDTVGELPKMANGFAAAAVRLREFVTEASKQGQINAAFRAGVAVLSDLGAIARNVGSIIVSVFQAASSTSSSLLGNLRQLTKQAADFLNTAKGSGALTSVFATLNSLGAALRTSLGAVLPAIADSIKVLGPALAGLAGPAARLVQALAPLLPLVAGLAATVITKLTPAIAALANYLAQNATAVKVLAGAFVAYVAIVKTAAVITGVQAAGGMLAYLKATQIATVATKAFSAAQLVLGAAMRFALGPIGLVITAVAALVAGVVYAYKNHEGFRNVVNAVWKTVRDVVVSASAAIGKAIKVAWEEVIRPAVNALVSFFRNVVAPTVTWLWKNVTAPAFSAIGALVKAAFAVVQLAAAITVAYFRNVLAPIFTWLWKNVVVPVFNGIKNQISNTWLAVRVIFTALGNYINNVVAPAFRLGVSSIAAAWNKLREAARVPVAFVVNKVINPLIGGFNRVAGVFGTSKVDPIPGFAEGGRIPGNSGGIDDRLAQVVDKGGKLLGAVTVASGEFIVNAKDTARALPLLKWINDGMKGGALGAERRIGRGPVDRPGDGSEGWAFAKGGLVGFLGDIWGAITDPKKAILKPVEAALGAVPGGGLIRGLLLAMGKKLASGLVGFLGKATGGGDVGGNLGKAMSFVRAQNGKPYVWASAGPGGYDCSGIVSAAWNILHGRSPYQHTFSTGQLPGKFFPKDGPGGLLTAGWAHPGQRGASASVGHMAGQFIGGMSFESTGSRGVHINTGRRPNDFAHQGHFAGGGQIPLFDRGGTLMPGLNTVYNGLGRPENLIRADGGGGDIHVHIHDSVVVNEKNATDLVVKGYNAAIRNRQIPAPVTKR